MQVILFKNIERLGMQGDVVNVAAGYFRNYLGPRGIAIEASANTLARLEIKRQKMRAEAERQIGEADVLARQLKDVQIKYVMKTAPDGQRLFGSVGALDIVEKLAALGFTTIERRQIALHEPIKNVGAHAVKIKMLGSVEAHVTVIVEAENAPPAEPVRAPKAAKAAEAPKAEATPEEPQA